jgi:cytochrome d ubiquinol oxidase subunit II
MTLNIIWYVLFVIIIAGYLILDGFDLGVGILHLFIGKNDTERRLVLNSIGPIWDGNEVWLIVGGGVLFAAFPLAYASLFSGFYLAMMLVLLFLILRTVAIEFRSKREPQGWRNLWDIVFSLSSLCIALLLGVAFGNIIAGLPLDAEGNIHIMLFEMLKPFPLLVGITAVAMMAMHGAIFLLLKTGDELQQRVKHWAPRLMVIFFVLNSLVVAAVFFFQTHTMENYNSSLLLGLFPAIALVALIVAWRMVRAERYFVAFVASSAMITLLLFSGAIGLYPNLLISSIDPANNLTINNAASANNTLRVMLVITLIGLPFVLAYTAGVYYFFRGKTELTAESY